MSSKKPPSPPSPSSLPPDAQREILNRLSTETRISSQEIAAILERHGVCGDMDALQDAYRKRLGQRLMATIFFGIFVPVGGSVSRANSFPCSFRYPCISRTL